MDPLSATFGAISVLSTRGELVQSSQTFAHNYKNAQSQIRHAECQWTMLSSTVQDFSLQANLKHVAAQTSFEAIRERIPSDLRADSRMTWRKSSPLSSSWSRTLRQWRRGRRKQDEPALVPCVWANWVALRDTVEPRYKNPRYKNTLIKTSSIRIRFPVPQGYFLVSLTKNIRIAS